MGQQLEDVERQQGDRIGVGIMVEAVRARTPAHAAARLIVAATSCDGLRRRLDRARDGRLGQTGADLDWRCRRGPASLPLPA